MPPYQRRLLDDLQQKASDAQVWKAFQSRRRLHVATDGGLLIRKGTHGWVISTGTKVLFTCAGPVDGPFDTASSTRSELAGCASATYFISCLSTFWGIKHKCRFLWYCDSKAAISRVRRYASWNSYRTRLPLTLTSWLSYTKASSTSADYLNRSGSKAIKNHAAPAPPCLWHLVSTYTPIDLRPTIGTEENAPQLKTFPISTRNNAQY